MNNAYPVLAFSVCAETVATTLMRSAEVFTRLLPGIIVLIGYAISFLGLSHVVKTMNVGIAYAIWAGAGMFLVSIMSSILYKQRLEKPAIFGVLCIVFGIIVIRLFSKSTTH